MNRQITVKTLAAALLLAALGMGWSAHSTQAVEQPTYTVNQAITVQEKGKSPRKCTIVAATKQSDGSTTYTLKAADTGELITIHDKPAPKGTKPESAKAEMAKATVPVPVKTETVKAPEPVPAPVAKVEAKPVAALKAPAPVITVELAKPAELPKQTPVKPVEKVVEKAPPAASAQATKFTDPIPLAKDRSSDPLLQLPSEARREARPEPIIANVNEASKTKPIVAKSEAPVRENRGFFGWLSGSKSSTTANASPASTTVSSVKVGLTVPAPTVVSTMTSKPVIVETAAPASKPGLASVSPYGTVTPGRAVVVETNAPGLAVVGEPMKAMPKSMGGPALTPAAPAMMAQPPVMLPSSMMPSVYPSAPAMPAMPTPPVSQGPGLLPRDVQLQKTLKEALQPSEREIAAMQLCDTSNARSTAVRTALMTAAKEDPAATVRAACLRCLVKVAPGEYAVMTVLESAKEDKDARVRNEANELMGQLKK